MTPAARSGTTPGAASAEVAVLLLADLAAGHRAWGWWRLMRGPRALAAEPGLRFAKLLGSGVDGRFGLRPSGSVRGLFALFDDASTAVGFVTRSPLVAAYRAGSTDCLTLVLRAWSSRGRWAGQEVGIGGLRPDADRPVAALTRASIRPRRVLRFWRHAPAAQQALERADGCRLAVGLGEAPLLRQATFSVWDSVAAMDAYARSGAHLAAIQAAQREGHFSESMFVRFSVLQARGHWRGWGDGG